ncbi:MAG: alpha/beta fold hydrolase [Gammaproteobacteria bacterium]
MARPRPAVVLVHGLWFPAAFLALLARRLEGAGFRVRRFGYRTSRAPLDRAAGALAGLLEREFPEGAHLVGHSLGGLLILDTLHRHEGAGPGRVLMLGTPLQGSVVVRRTAGWFGVGSAIGHATTLLHAGHDYWPERREVGMIAGDRRAGLGQLSGALRGPNDGTVAVAETRDERLADHVVLPVTHSGMVFSSPVVRQAAHFLRVGRFRRAEPG